MPSGQWSVSNFFCCFPFPSFSHPLPILFIYLFPSTPHFTFFFLSLPLSFHPPAHLFTPCFFLLHLPLTYPHYILFAPHPLLSLSMYSVLPSLSPSLPLPLPLPLSLSPPSLPLSLPPSFPLPPPTFPSLSPIHSSCRLPIPLLSFLYLRTSLIPLEMISVHQGQHDISTCMQLQYNPKQVCAVYTIGNIGGQQFQQFY